MSKRLDLGGKRRDMLLLDPEDVELVTDEQHALYDPSVAAELDEELVTNVMLFGVLEPVLVGVTKDDAGGVTVVVIDGRTRTRANREANKRLVKEGKEPWPLPAVVKQGDDADKLGMLVAANLFRRPRSPFTRAEHMRRLLDLGKTTGDLQAIFGMSWPAVKYHLALLKCIPAVRKAVEQEKIGMVLAAKELADLEPAKQKEALETMLASGVTKGEGAKELAREVKTNGHASDPKAKAKKRMRARQVLERWNKALAPVESRDAKLARAVVSFVLGNDRALKAYPKLAEALE